jgi:hypothetical protein
MLNSLSLDVFIKERSEHLGGLDMESRLRDLADFMTKAPSSTTFPRVCIRFDTQYPDLDLDSLGVLQAIESLRGLRELELRSFWKLPSLPTSLEKLSLSHMWNSWNSISNMSWFPTLSCLTDLRLDHCPGIRDHQAVYSVRKTLQRLCITAANPPMDANNYGLGPLSQYTALRDLELGASFVLPEFQWFCLSTMSALTRLCFKEVNVYSAVGHLQLLSPTVVDLTLNGAYLLDDEEAASNWLAGLGHALNRLSQLTRLDLGGNSLSDLRCCPDLPRLRELCVGRNRQWGRPAVLSGAGVAPPGRHGRPVLDQRCRLASPPDPARPLRELEDLFFASLIIPLASAGSQHQLLRPTGR